MSTEGEELRKRFEKLKRETGISRAAFAKLHGLKGGDAMIYQHINGLKPISMDAGLIYARGFNVPLAEISQRLASEQSRISESNVEPVPPTERTIPVISYVQAGNWRDIVDNNPIGYSDDTIPARGEYGMYTFALRIMGNSMEPEFKEGDVVVIDPEVAPTPGDYVVARNHVEEATFKKYRPRGISESGNTIFELVPLNEDYAIMRSDQQTIQIIGTMVEHTRFRKR